MKKKTTVLIAFVAIFSSYSSFAQTKALPYSSDSEKVAWIKENPEAYKKMVEELKSKAVQPIKKETLINASSKEVTKATLKPKSEDTILLEKEIEANKNNPNYDLEFKMEKLKQARKFEIQETNSKK